MRNRFSTTRWLTFALIASTASLFAQERGTIRGTVLDPSGAVVSNARVTATNTATGVSDSAQTTGAGFYSIGQLLPGIYRVEAEAAGFKKPVRDDVRVNVAAVVGVDFTLEVGETNQSVTVEAEAPLLRSETAEVGTAIPPKSMIDLPLIANGGRAPVAFFFMSPGAQGS